jgi:hemolysin activation/secretion protein
VVRSFVALWLLLGAFNGLFSTSGWAQTLPPPPRGRDLSPSNRPFESPLPDSIREDPLPPPAELLPPSEETEDPTPNSVITGKVPIQECVVVGSTVFKAEDFLPITQRCQGQSLRFTDLLDIRSEITKLYVEKGYQTSGAYIPPQVLEDGVVTIQVIEGKIEDIRITGNKRLKPFYIRRQIESKIGRDRPLNINELLEALQLLQLDPLLDTINAELLAGTRPGTSLLDIQISEAPSKHLDINLNNGRSKTIGSFERELQFREDNLIGFGDGAFISFANTAGSNQIGIGYDVPLNGKNGRISANFSQVWSQVVDPSIENESVQFAGNSRNLSLNFRQPIIRKPNKEFALGIGLARRESETIIKLNVDCSTNVDIPPEDIILERPERCLIQPTKVTELLLTQDWLQRWRSSVLALRSEFGIGLNVITQESNQESVSSNFLSWRGQGQWVKRLGRDSLFLSRANLQLSNGALVSLEKFGLGGLNSVRGYQQDLELVDSGVFVSTEVRLPIFRGFDSGVLQVVPFVDAGHGWNFSDETTTSSTLAALGVGLRWEWSDRISAQFNWGVPLLSVEDQQGSGIESSQFFFSITGSPF